MQLKPVAVIPVLLLLSATLLVAGCTIRPQQTTPKITRKVTQMLL